MGGAGMPCLIGQGRFGALFHKDPKYVLFRFYGRYDAKTGDHASPF